MPGVTVTIQVEDGVYRPSGSIIVQHPNGDKIQIVGNEANPDDVRLVFEDSNGLEVNKGTRLGFFGGFTVAGNGANSPRAWGITVDSGAYLGLGTVHIDGFGRGFLAVRGAIVEHLSGESEIRVANTTDAMGIQLAQGSHASLGEVILQNNAGASLHVSAGSYLYANGLTVEDGGWIGVSVLGSSTLDVASHASSNNNAITGFRVETNSYAHMENAESVGNMGGYGFIAVGRSAISVAGSTADSNLLQNNVADTQSYIYARDARASGSVGAAGFEASGRSFVYASGASSVGNGGWGVHASRGGYVVGPLADVRNNAAGAYSPLPNTPAEDRVAAHDSYILTEN